MQISTLLAQFADETRHTNHGIAYSVDRVVRLDLNHCAFIGTSTRLNKHARAGLWALIGKLKEGAVPCASPIAPTVNRKKALEARTRKLEYLVDQLW